MREVLRSQLLWSALVWFSINPRFTILTSGRSHCKCPLLTSIAFTPDWILPLQVLPHTPRLTHTDSVLQCNLPSQELPSHTAPTGIYHRKCCPPLRECCPPIAKLILTEYGRLPIPRNHSGSSRITLSISCRKCYSPPITKLMLTECHRPHRSSGITVGMSEALPPCQGLY